MKPRKVFLVFATFAAFLPAFGKTGQIEKDPAIPGSLMARVTTHQTENAVLAGAD